MPPEPQSRTSPTFDAIVVACDSGPAVRRAIAALPDARRCILLDPSGLISDEELPAHAIRVGSAAAALAASDAAWVLLTTDGEVLPAGTFDAVIRAITPSTAPDGVRVVIEQHGLATRLTPRRAPVRIARRAGLRLAVDTRLDIVLCPSGRSRATLGGVFERQISCGAADATRALDAESKVLAALLRETGGRPRVRAAAIGALAAAWNVRTARRHSGRRADHSIAMVVAGYRVILTYARLWERAYALGEVT